MLFENVNDRQLAYEAELKRLLDRSDILDGKAIKDIQGFIISLQQRLVGRLNQELILGDAASDWGLFWLPRLGQAVEEVLRDLADRTASLADRHLIDSYSIGTLLADRPISAASGLEIVTPRITVTQLAVLAPYRSKLIKDISEVTREKIDQAVKAGVAFGESPDVLMKEIEGLITTKGTPFRSVAKRAETIIRTEVARSQSIAHEARTRDIVTEFPSLTQGPHGMKQIFVSVNRGPYPCKICAPLEGTIWEIHDPKKPNPPTSTHPNCRCQMVSYFPGISSKRRIPEPPFRRQVDASLSECVCCH